MYMCVTAPPCQPPLSYIPDITALTSCHALKLFFPEEKQDL